MAETGRKGAGCLRQHLKGECPASGWTAPGAGDALVLYDFLRLRSCLVIIRIPSPRVITWCSVKTLPFFINARLKGSGSTSVINTAGGQQGDRQADPDQVKDVPVPRPPVRTRGTCSLFTGPNR